MMMMMMMTMTNNQNRDYIVTPPLVIYLSQKHSSMTSTAKQIHLGSLTSHVSLSSHSWNVKDRDKCNDEIQNTNRFPLAPKSEPD